MVGDLPSLWLVNFECGNESNGGEEWFFVLTDNDRILPNVLAAFRTVNKESNSDYDVDSNGPRILWRINQIRLVSVLRRVSSTGSGKWGVVGWGYNEETTIHISEDLVDQRGGDSLLMNWCHMPKLTNMEEHDSQR